MGQARGREQALGRRIRRKSRISDCKLERNKPLWRYRLQHHLRKIEGKVCRHRARRSDRKGAVEYRRPAAADTREFRNHKQEDYAGRYDRGKGYHGESPYRKQSRNAPPEGQGNARHRRRKSCRWYRATFCKRRTSCSKRKAPCCSGRTACRKSARERNERY